MKHIELARSDSCWSPTGWQHRVRHKKAVDWSPWKYGYFGKNDLQTDEWEIECRPLFSEDQMTAAYETMRKERDHWKANHDNIVAAAQVLIERQDTPFERTHTYRAYVALQEQVDALRSCLENIRLFAARQRGEEWARTILRFCPPGSPLRKEQENGA